MAHPYQLIAAIGLLIAIYGSGFWTGHRWAEGDAAIEAGKAVTVAVEKAKAEDAEQMKVATRNSERRSAARLRQQKLEQELATDELAKNCHVSVGTYSVLSGQIAEANKTASGGVNGNLPPSPKPTGFIRGGFSAVDWILGNGLRGVQPEAARLNRLDQ